MWFLLKSVLGLAAAAALAYVVFFVNLAGKPLAAHVDDVWRSPVMQQKVALVKHGVEGELENRLASAAAQATRNGVRHAMGDDETISNADRASLDRVIDGTTPTRSRSTASR